MIADGSDLQHFAKCLKLFPNLHTLEIWGDKVVTASFEKALKGVNLPQIKTLILSTDAHPILRHCRNVEDVVYVAEEWDWLSDEFLEPFESNPNSKVKRLAIPLNLWLNPSRE